jgi:tRNA threonylcarbamoyladenosine biosynthesis protein TsaB
MLILTIRTDKPEAELGLFNGSERLAYSTWRAHRELAETIHAKLAELLEDQDQKLTGLKGVIVFKGPGSFTGLRIGISVGNALADSLRISIVGEEGEGWIEHGIKKLADSQNEQIVLPVYGAPPHITAPKH